MINVYTIYKIIIFMFKYLWIKLFHFFDFSVLSIKTMMSRCRWSSEFNIIGKSKIKLGIIECATNTRLAATAGGYLEVGDHCYFNRNCTLNSRNSIIIGNRCTLGPNVCIFDHDHEFGRNGQTGKFKIGNIQIGDNCWIGAGVIILRNTFIGNNCVIGAGCIVKGTIPDNSLVCMDRELKIIPLHE